MRLLICAFLVVIQAVGLSSADPDPFAFFRPSVALSSSERQSLERGDPVVAMLHGEGHELAVFSAIQVGRDVTIDRAVAWMRQVEELRRGRYLLATGRFSQVPQLGDLEALTLDVDDLEDIRVCRPGRCDLKLSAREIAHLRGTIEEAGPRWQEKLQVAFREIVLARVLAFAHGGHPRLDDYCDRKRPRSPAAAFAGVLDHSAFLERNMPHLARHLALCASRPVPGAETFIYWSKERLGSKAVISATSITLLQGGAVHHPELLMVSVQIFATHYLDASLGVTALVSDERSSRSYFVYVNRSDVDVLGGFWGAFARPLIEARIRKDAPAILRQVSARLSNGDPRPRAGVQAPSPVRP